MRYLADNPQWLWLWDKYGIATQTFRKIYVITKIKQSMTNKLFFNSWHGKLQHQEALGWNVKHHICPPNTLKGLSAAWTLFLKIWMRCNMVCNEVESQPFGPPPFSGPPLPLYESASLRALSSNYTMNDSRFFLLVRFWSHEIWKQTRLWAFKPCQMGGNFQSWWISCWHW